ncbi:HAUS augmin-like complex subunit 3 isoform X2 [Prorops nasuta]|uniref:HAUS augmin-like complex subunit 3 isoform X2 n=1 Tax=Prorops nasuta TaxID=863751 RepID=UPI0034CDD330
MKKMSISSKHFYDKISDLRPDCATFPQESLDVICNDSALQPFLHWFCSNVTRANVLTDEEVKLKNQLQKSGEWLEGTDLDDALEKACKEYPEMLKLISYDDAEMNELSTELNILKENYHQDQIYLKTLQHGIKNFKELEDKIDDDIEQAENQLEKGQILLNKVYNDCTFIVEKLDSGNRDFYNSVVHLQQTYANAAENKDTSILWSQMPIELFAKQMQLYYDYLSLYIKRQLEHSDTFERLYDDSDYNSFINDSKEKQFDEIMLCKQRLAISKMDEIKAKIQKESVTAMFKCVKDIYNNGFCKLPAESNLREEIIKLTRERDCLEENLMLLQQKQLFEVAEHFADIEMNKLIENNAQASLQRRKLSLEKLNNLLLLTKQHGHATSDLLCILMDMQNQHLHEVAEFIADAVYYLTTEYSLSSHRCESMIQQQHQFDNLLSSPETSNFFYKIFTSMVSNGESSADPLRTAIKKYHEIIKYNEEQMETLLERALTNKLKNLELLETKVNKNYLEEVSNSPTKSLNLFSYEICTSYKKNMKEVEDIQSDVLKIRNTSKELMRRDHTLVRKKEILWQSFLSDPESLKVYYNKAYTEIKEFC